MSIQQLQSDLEEVKKALPTGQLVSSQEVMDFLKHNLVPLIESHVNETAEIDEAVHDLVTHEADILHEETAGVFASLVVSGRELAKQLMSRAGKDPQIAALCKEHLDLCEQAEEILDEITVDDPQNVEETKPDSGEATPELPSPGDAEQK